MDGSYYIIATVCATIVIVAYGYVRRHYWKLRLGCLRTVEDAKRWASISYWDYDDRPKGMFSMDILFRPSPLAASYSSLKRIIRMDGGSYEYAFNLFMDIIKNSNNCEERIGAVVLMSACWASPNSQEALLEIANNPDAPEFNVCIRCLYLNIDPEFAKETVMTHINTGKLKQSHYSYMFSGESLF